MRILLVCVVPDSVSEGPKGEASRRLDYNKISLVMLGLIPSTSHLPVLSCLTTLTVVTVQSIY
jgi:hypothetical protein